MSIYFRMSVPNTTDWNACSVDCTATQKRTGFGRMMTMYRYVRVPNDTKRVICFGADTKPIMDSCQDGGELFADVVSAEAYRQVCWERNMFEEMWRRLM